MDKKIWRYDKPVKPPVPQALVSLYVTTTVVCSVAVFFLIFMFARRTYGYVPHSLTTLSLFIIIGCPSAVMLWSFLRSSSPKCAMRAFTFYLDDDGELWMFDYNASAFEAIYEQKALPSGKNARISRFGGNKKERALEFCISSNAVLDVLDNPPYDRYAHHIVKVTKMQEKGGYLLVQFTCLSAQTKKDYSGSVSLPADMDGLDELRVVFESMLIAPDNALKPRSARVPGTMRIEAACDEVNGSAILSGVVVEGTVARGDRVACVDEGGSPLFDCKLSHIYRDGREIVWADFSKNDETVYELHIKGRSLSDFKPGYRLITKK